MAQYNTHGAEPLVSVIIPVYNGANYMREAIDSALAQTYPNIEVLVINDGSTDDGATAKAAEAYADKIRYFEKENGGVSSALNLGIRNMRGSYFSWLSHDDIYEPTKIEKQVSLLQTYEDDRLLAYCSADFIDADGRVFPNSLSQRPDRRYNHREAMMALLRRNMAGCSFLIPRQVFDAVGLFDEDLRYISDTQMWRNIFLGGFSLVTSSDLGVHYRIHNKQVTQTMRGLYQAEAAQVADELVPVLAANSDREFNFLYYYAKEEALHHNRHPFALCMAQAAETGLFSVSQRLKLRAVYLYGSVRPFIRRMYYKVFKKVETT